MTSSEKKNLFSGVVTVTVKGGGEGGLLLIGPIFSAIFTGRDPRPAGLVGTFSKSRGPNRVGPGGVLKSHQSGRATLTRPNARAVTRPKKSPEYCLTNGTLQLKNCPKYFQIPLVAAYEPVNFCHRVCAENNQGLNNCFYGQDTNRGPSSDLPPEKKTIELRVGPT